MFLATLSHELRTPLNAIYGWARMLRTRELDKQHIERAVEAIERNSVLQAQLVNDLLDVSRIIAGKLQLAIRPVILTSAIENAIETLRQDAETKGVGLELAMESSARTVVGDPLRLHQIITNLVSNAIKFTPPQGRVSVSLALSESSARIAVHDTGRGIAPDALPSIFERFGQGGGARTRTEKGLGLGLAIVRHLVELHGGMVSPRAPGWVKERRSSLTCRSAMGPRMSMRTRVLRTRAP